MTKPLTRRVLPSGRDNPDHDFVTGFMCMVDFDHELGCASGGNSIYPSEEDLRKHRKCVDKCGIVEVRVQFVRVVQEGAF